MRLSEYNPGMDEQSPKTVKIERATRAALTVAGTLGLDVERAELIHYGCNATIRLHPFEIVARVSGNAGGFSSHAAARQRELDVSRYLATIGAPVIPPSSAIAAGPYEEDGLIVSFWDYVTKSSQQMKKVNALHALHACHEALADYPGELPFLHGYADARRLFLRFWRDDVLEADEVHEILDRISKMDEALTKMQEDMPSPPVPIHGDAHFSNTICISEDNFLWIDWEDVCCGPVEWDYACMMVDLENRPWHNFGAIRDIKAAIKDKVDHDRLDLLIEARELQSDIWAACP
jgi:thiamine kinase-like enzyme